MRDLSLAAPRRAGALMLAALLSVVLAGSGLPPANAAPNSTSAAGTPPMLSQPPAKVQKASKVTLAVNETVLRKGERLWLTGKVAVGSSAQAKRKVIIERRPLGGAWKKIRTATTGKTGKYTVKLRPNKKHQYRARVAANSTSRAAISPVRTVGFSASKRNITQRAKSLGSRLGKSQGKAVKLSAAKRKATGVKGVQRVWHKKYSKGTLVKVTTNKANRTWFVAGKIEKIYRKAGGPAGKYGVPLQDARCGLRENSCVQRFSKGVIYSSSTASAGTHARGRKGEVIAAARSQVGYKYRYGKPSVQYTKYNKFMGSTRAWCSFFLSWSSSVSGNGKLIPKSKSFPQFKVDVKKTMKTGHTPKAGALVFFNTYGDPKKLTHTGIVVSVGKNTIRVIDGNTVGNLPSGHRGILERDWPKSRALLYAYPNY